jgi:hypothetical protein
LDPIQVFTSDWVYFTILIFEIKQKKKKEDYRCVINVCEIRREKDL